MPEPIDPSPSLGADERRSLIEAHERQLEMVRNSVQYRIGQMVMDAVQSPSAALRLPVRLWRLRTERRSFRQSMRNEGAAEPSLPPRLESLTIDTVLDPFSQTCFAPEAALEPIAFSGPTTTANARMLLAESVWTGVDGSWEKRVTSAAGIGRFEAITRDEAAGGRPTVFWNKEDPVHFEHFLPVASLFDWVFTTDSASVDRYRETLGHDRVAPLPFAAQPAVHHPDWNPEIRRNVACFAGSWRGDQYAERGHAASWLLRPLVDSRKLHIFDRQARPGATGSQFPKAYRSAVRGYMPYPELIAAYRGYSCFVNINSVTDSPTMLARRVFEVLASGTPVVSSPSAAIEPLLGDTVDVVETSAEALVAVERYISDSYARDAAGLRGYRRVLDEHTYELRLGEILRCVGIEPRRENETVGVIVSTHRPDRLDQVVANLDRQSFRWSSAVVVCHGFQPDREHWGKRSDAVQVISVDGSRPLGECLNVAIDNVTGRYVARFDDDDFYGAEYLADQVRSFKHHAAAVVGKKTVYFDVDEPGRLLLRSTGFEFQYVDRVAGATIVIDRQRWPDARFDEVASGVDSLLLDRARAKGHAIYSTSRFGFVAERRGDLGTHTWRIPKSELVSGGVLQPLDLGSIDL